MKLRRSERLRGLQRPSYYLRSSSKGSSSKGSSSKGSFAAYLEHLASLRRPLYFSPPYTKANLKPDSEIITILHRSLKTVRCLTPPDAEVSLPRSVSVPVPVPCSIAEEPGLVVGNLVYYDSGNIIDCSKRGTGGTLTPPDEDIDLVEFRKETDALFILLVGSPFAFNALAKERFYRRFPCVIVTANGAPEFVCKMERDLKLPVLAWLNCDPSALEILSFYGRRLNNNIKWVGISPSDVLEHRMDKDHLNLTLPMNENEFKTANQLLGDAFVNNHQSWLHELDTMLATKEKAEFQAMPCFGYKYLTEVFLPMKLQRGDWL